MSSFRLAVPQHVANRRHAGLLSQSQLGSAYTGHGLTCGSLVRPGLALIDLCRVNPGLHVARCLTCSRRRHTHKWKPLPPVRTESNTLLGTRSRCRGHRRNRDCLASNTRHSPGHVDKGFRHARPWPRRGCLEGWGRSGTRQSSPWKLSHCFLLPSSGPHILVRNHDRRHKSRSTAPRRGHTQDGPRTRGLP